MKISSNEPGRAAERARPELKSVKHKRESVGQPFRSDMALCANMSVLKPPAYKARLQSLRRRARLTPRAAREVDAENQNLDGHGG